MLSPGERQDDVLNGQQMGLAQKEGLVVLYMRLPRAKASQHKKKWETHVDLA